MYKAIIVDDERKVGSLILELGDWKRLRIQVEAVCTDGEEALETICRVQPDMVLTDVRMPGYDGLELIRRVSERGLSPAFIIISGYKYFEYAYSAFKYGVIDYLLKPIDQKQLNEVLEKTCRILAQRRSYARAEDELRRLSRDMEKSNRRKMFTNLFDDPETFPSAAEELEERYQKTFPAGVLQVFVIRTNRSLEEEENRTLSEKIRDTVKRLFCGKSEEERERSPIRVCMEPIHGEIAVILNYPEEESGRVRSILQTLLEDVMDVASLYGNSRVSLGLGPAVTELAELPESARLAEEAERAKVVLGTNRILELSAQHFSRLSLEQIFTENDRRTLHNAIETLNAGAMSDWLDRLEITVDKHPPLRPEVVLGLRDAIYGEMETYARAHHLDDGFDEFTRNWSWETEQAAGISNFFWCLRDLIENQMEIWKEARDSEEKLPVRLAKAYIGEHYSEAVTLEQVAEEVGLSPAYFSTRFRRVEGRTFSDYLTSVRMEAAKELLATTNMTNYSIAASIGYSDEKYFGKVFKKEVGIRPGEYRKLYYDAGSDRKPRG